MTHTTHNCNEQSVHYLWEQEYISVLSDCDSQCHSKPQGGPARRVYSSTPLTLFAWLRARVRPSVVHVHVQCSQQSKFCFLTNLCIPSKLHHLCNLNSIKIYILWSINSTQKNCFCTSVASLLAIYGEKQILRKLQSSSLMFFECEKVDLTAEIKISQNVISLLGALYTESGMRLTNMCVCSMKTKCVWVH